jgi:hypothetical protein
VLREPDAQPSLLQMKPGSTGPLSQAFASAQAHADVWNRPPSPWKPRRRRWLSRPALFTLAAIAGVVTMTIAVDIRRPGSVAVGLPADFPSDSITVAAPPNAPTEARHPAVASDRWYESSGSAAPAVDTVVTEIERHGSMLTLVLRKSRLSDAVHALAQATNAQVRGTEYLTPDARTVTLEWRGSSAASAWRVLLAGIANTAVTCKESKCQIWFVAAPARNEEPVSSGVLDERVGDRLQLPQHSPRAQEATGARPVVVDRPSSAQDQPAEEEPSG